MPEQLTHGVLLIAEDDIPYSTLGGADNMELSRGLTFTATTSLAILGDPWSLGSERLCQVFTGRR